ncbi:hypothetical protein CO666_25290 [Rhizobium chutanense]|uniref:Uncharacterized protein n=1 Tax=Rhizobium chutanense TaxID=2035448 RepID=A0A2A6J5L2_9HYPH|nr:hypothetical protein [Rhizobium chutanense]PDT01416.1 hypothetical protein CO666_25290 [Rhizobium chutanense]
MAKFKDKTINGATYAMGHLEDIVIQVQKGDATFKVLVTYSCHCFTEELKPHHTPDFHYVHKHEKRAFCLVRHGLSHNLPNYIANLLGRPVYLTKQTNFFFIRSNGGNYVVFFALRPARNPRYDAILTVQSAHLRTNFTRKAQPVTFDDLVEAKVKNTPVTPGRKQTIKRS